MTLADVLQGILQRLGPEGDTVLASEQVRRWPKGATEALQEAGWVVPIAAATMVECSGCEENCFKPVHVLPARHGQPVRAYVACDEPPAMGRVKIPLSRLRQWQVTDAQLARWLTGALELKGNPERDQASGVFTLGNLQGKKRMGVLQFDSVAPVSLKVSGHAIPLSEVVNFEGNRPIIDRTGILGMVDLPPVSEAAGRRPTSTARREARKLDTQAMHERWQKAYRVLKRKHRDKSDVWCSLQIAKTDNPQGRSAETIRKHMKK